MNHEPYRIQPSTTEPAEDIPDFHAPAAVPSRSRWRFVVRAACLLTPVASVTWHWACRQGQTGSPDDLYFIAGVPFLCAWTLVVMLAAMRLEGVLLRWRARRTASEVARLMARDDVRWDPRATVRKY